MAHRWKPVGKLFERDIIRTVKCEECGLGAAQVVSSKEICGKDYLPPDCETLYVKLVLET